jgi:hypothetical protein
MRFAIVAMLLACKVTTHEPTLEKLVDVPMTVAELNARAKPPEIVVKIEHHDVPAQPPGSKGGGGACHSAACALLWLIPDRGTDAYSYDVGSIVEKGNVTFEGLYNEGSFGGGTLREPGRIRYVKIVDALSIQRQVLVEVATATVAPDGTIGDQVPTPILPQVDLAPAYLEKIIAAQKHHQHEPGSLGDKMAKLEPVAKSIVNELARILAPDERRALFAKWQSDSRLVDVVKQAMIDASK